MKKMFKMLASFLMAGALVLTAVPSVSASAADGDYDGEVTVYVGFGGDVESENDWGYQYNDPQNAGNAGDIIATTASAKVGDTVTVALEFPSEVVNTWWMAPVIVTDDDSVVFGTVDANVTLQIDGEDVAIDTSAKDAWWAEGTGDYTNAVRLAGGFNEWGTKYIEEPSGFTKVEYTITINSLSERAVVNGTDYTGDVTAYVGFGGDVESDNDWGYQYNDPDNAGNAGDIEAVLASGKVGDTLTISLTFPKEVYYTWWVAPVLVTSDDSVIFADVDADVTLKIDGKEVSIDSSAGDAWWAEATGDYINAVRLLGGYNEWGTCYIEEPKDFTTIEYTITINALSQAKEGEVSSSSAGPVDLDGTYNAYIGLQSPSYTFRNAYDDASYGYGTPEFDQLTGWADDGSEIVIPGTIHDAQIAGNGTYTVSVDGIEFADTDFANQDTMRMIYISTDIPNTGEVTISNVTLTIDGSKVDLSKNGAIINEESVDYLQIQLQSEYNDDVATIGYYVTPFTSIEISFDADGFNYDKTEDEAIEQSTDSSTDTAAADASTQETSGEDEGNTESTGSFAKTLVVIVVIVALIAICAGVIVSKKKK